MRKVTIISFLLVIAFASFGQINWTKINPNKSIDPQIEVVQSTENELIVKMDLNAYRLLEVETPRGAAFVVKSPECPNSYYKGAPDLPFITSSIVIPDQGGFKYEVISAQFETIENIEIAPSKGSILRTIDPETVPYEYGRAYQMNEFLPFDNAQMGEPFILRALRGSNITFYPFKYNAVSKELQVYTEIIVKIKFDQSNSTNEITNQKSVKVEEFINIYDRAFLNYRNTAKYIPIEEGAPGKMLIVCADEYASAMASFITWKHEKGIETDLVLLSEIGTTANQVKAYIQNYYDTEELAYVLLIGDADDVPTMTVSSNDSDNGYVYLAGGDGYADALIGRFSASSIADVQTQAQRMIDYERDMSTADTWLENAFGSASNEGGGTMGHDGGESDEVHINNIRTDLQTYGYTVTIVNQDGGSNAQISTAFNNGIGIANYIGHGDVTLWANTSFSNTQVNALTNTKKLPFIWSVACVNGDFNGNTCFAEAWLRATNAGSPAGAVGFLGSTINQAWNEPMTGQDEMVDILIETYSSNIKRTYGGLSFNGMFQMIQEGGAGQETADTWTLFGDPSLMVRTKAPQEMTISHLGTLSVGQTEFMVSCDAENALVSLTTTDGDQTIIIGYAYVSGGSANVTIIPFDSPGNMKVTVTAYNKVTYQEDVMVIVPDGPYVVADGYSINDSEANNNGVADYNETIKINQTLLNVGVDAATSVNVVASTTNTNANITVDEASFGDMAIDETKTVNDAFTIVVADGISDQEIIPISLQISDGDDNLWESNYNILANAPKMNLSFVQIDDTDSGNGNFTIDAGETVNLVVQVLNNGHAVSQAGDIVISTTNEFATIGTSSLNFDAQDVNSPIEIEFTVTIDEAVPTGTSICFDFALTAGMYPASLNTCLPAGLQIEDWESGTLTSFDWENSTTYPWTIVTNEVYEGTNALKSGTPTGGGESTLIINLDVLNTDELEFYKKVSCEGLWFGTMYDYLSFSIDGAEQDKWCDEIDWSYESYSISAGERELKWSYVKDASFDEGSDCAWVDNIKLPAHQASVTIINQPAIVLENSVEVYPNPASDIVYINVNLEETTTGNVKIMNINGQVVYEYSNEFKMYKGENSIIINTSEFANGLYIVQVNTAENFYNKNLIINR
ncbi:MAG: T9SS type A sorting domain-containing protein [Bacteroidales bacterium]|nr:T9SS type A sorting domain-containing protein [Bacteroidales bacterium]